MALHRKIDALMALRPDLAVIPEAAEPGRLVDRVPALAEAVPRLGGHQSAQGAPAGRIRHDPPGIQQTPP